MRALAMILLPVLPLVAQGKGKAPKSAPAPVEAPAPKPVKWDGEWVLAAEGSDDLATAIPEHVKALNFVMKPLWKHKIEKACAREAFLSFIAGSNLTATFGKEIPVTIQGDGSAAAWKRADGESFQVSMAKEGPKVTLTFEGDGFLLKRVMVMAEDGASFTLRTTYQHPKCPAGDFSYQAVYKRKE